MRKSKLITLLRGLTKAEMKELESFLHAPMFVVTPEVLKLYKSLFRQYPKYDTERIEKDNLAGYLFPKDTEKNALKKLNYTMSSFTKIVEEYILWIETKQQTNDRDFLLLKAYRRRNIDKLFFKTGHDFLKRLEKSPIRDAQYYHDQFQVNNIIYHHTNTVKGAPQESLKETIKNLDLFYISARLMQYLYILTRKAQVVENSNILLTEEILELVKSDPLKTNPLLNIYQLLIDYLQGNKVDEAHYFQTKEMFFEHFDIFSKLEKENIITFIINYANLLYKSGKEHFFEELFDLHNFTIERRILFVDNFLLSTIYYNTVNIGCELGKLDWAEEFIEKNSIFLRKNVRHSMKELSLAHFHCCKKNYDQTLICLRSLEFKNHIYEITSKVLITRCYFEERNEELLSSFLHSFTAFVRRHKRMPTLQKEAVLNFIKFTSRISRNWYSRKYTKEQLLQQISEHPNLNNRRWLRQKVEELRS